MKSSINSRHVKVKRVVGQTVLFFFSSMNSTSKSSGNYQNKRKKGGSWLLCKWRAERVMGWHGVTRVGGVSVTGEVFLQWCEQVPNHRDAPRPSQESLPGQTTHVGHVRVVDRKSKHPEGGDNENLWCFSNDNEIKSWPLFYRSSLLFLYASFNTETFSHFLCSMILPIHRAISGFTHPSIHHPSRNLPIHPSVPISIHPS